MSRWDSNAVQFSELTGKTITEITGAESGSNSIAIVCSDESRYEMYHDQDCCESVSVEDVCGDLPDVIGSPITMAEEVTSGQNPDDIKKECQYSFTWTFYKLGTINGSITIRWYGESNGYYSESVDFYKTK